MAETPSVFYPACLVDLRILFDDALTLVPEPAVLETFSTERLAFVPSPTAKAVGNPEVIGGQADPNLSFITSRIPISASVELPAYREAGTFRITLDYRDLPIDPRLVRSCSVEIYLSTIPGTQFGIGMTQRAPQFERESILRRNVRASSLAAYQRGNEDCLMVGVVDTWDVEHNDKGSEVTLQGRDLRGMLLNSPMNADTLATLPLKNNIIEVVQFIVSKHPAGGRIHVEGSPKDEWPNSTIPIPGGSFTTRVRKGAKGDKSRGSAGGDTNVTNFWDVISKYCAIVGAVPFFQGNLLFISPAKNLYDQQRQSTVPRNGSAFNDAREGVEGNVRQFIYGYNVEELRFERKYTGKRPTSVVVTSYNTSSTKRGEEKYIEARWPDDSSVLTAGVSSTTAKPIAKDIRKAKQTTVNPSGQSAQEDVVRYDYPGIADKARLLQLAQDIYEEIGRGEAGGSVSTQSLASFGGNNNDADVLRLRPGDAVRIGIGVKNKSGQTTSLDEASSFLSPPNLDASVSETTLLKSLNDRGLDPNLARAIVLSSRNYVKELQNTFRVSNVKFDWNISSGVKVAFDFQNYIRPRHEITPTPERIEQPAVVKRATSRTGG